MSLPLVCYGCGACCTNKDSKWVEVTKQDAFKIDIDLLQQGDTEAFAMKQDDEGNCVALTKSHDCAIYKNRPTICRTTQRNGKICLSSVKEREISKFDKFSKF